MDDEHEAILARILAERQRRGDLIDRRSISGRQNVIDQTQADMRQEELSAQRRQREQQQLLQQQQQQNYPSSPQPTSAFETRSAPASPSYNQQQQNQQQRLPERNQVGNANVQSIQNGNNNNNLQQQQSMMGDARPLPVLGQGNPSNNTNSQYQNQQQRTSSPPKQQVNSTSPVRQNNINNNNQQQAGAVAATPSSSSGAVPLPQNGTNVQTTSTSQIERGKFINFSKAPILEMNDIRKLRSYAKGEAPTHREINFQGQKVVHQLNAPNNRNADGETNIPQTPQQQGNISAQQQTPGGFFRSGSAVPLSQSRGQSVVSQQRYPAASHQQSNNVVGSPSVAQLAQSARYQSQQSNRGNSNMSMTTRQIQATERELASQVSETNPFRTQSFEDYCKNPDNQTIPVDILDIIRDAKTLTNNNGSKGSSAVWNHKGQQLTAPQEGAVSQPMIGKAMFNFSAACSLLIQGDWFLKWTRHKDKVHRRFFRISPDGELFLWARNTDASLAFSSVVRISDFASIEPSCVVDEVTSQTIYVMTIWSTTRVTQIGTEYREKFDIWYETLRRLAQKHRTQNHAFASRHATLVASDQTAAATAMTMRQGLMGGKISSAD